MVTQACSNITIVGDIPEDLAAKVKLFQTLEQLCSALQLQHPGRFLGIRFFHPCVLLRPVEVTVGSSTMQNTVDRVVAFLQCLDKLPHRGPTKRVLREQEVSAFQFDTAVRGNFYHGLLEPKRLASVAEIITPQAGPPLVGPNFNSDTTSL
ncbi:hypothetical protein BBJ28_00007511 [Nothophytophthora sp. Chile5]|nr:hypothetical protein BBJ28_00007511 [Nothophytophthora sp. Chile5]